MANEVEPKISENSQSIANCIGIKDLSDETVTAIAKHVNSKSNFYGKIGSQIPLNDILEKANGMEILFEKAREVQSNNKSQSIVHGVQHVQNVLLLSNYIGIIQGVSENDLEIIREAAIYHDYCHEIAGDPTHAVLGSYWYLNNIESTLNKAEVAYLILSHELSGRDEFEQWAMSTFTDITEKRKEELIKCAEILQDADRLDILRYDIENPKYQRFNPDKLNLEKSKELISAVIELNTHQAIGTEFLTVENNEVCQYSKSFKYNEFKENLKIKNENLNNSNINQNNLNYEQKENEIEL